MTKSKSEGGMAFVTYPYTNTLSWPSKRGAYCKIKPHYFIRYLNHAFFQIALSWRQWNLVMVHMLGKVYYMAVMLSNMALVGE